MDVNIFRGIISMILNFRIKIRTGKDMICGNSFEVPISGGLFKKKLLNPFVKARGRKKKLSRILMHLEGNTTYFRPSNLRLVMTCVTYHA